MKKFIKTSLLLQSMILALPAVNVQAASNNNKNTSVPTNDFSELYIADEDSSNKGSDEETKKLIKSLVSRINNAKKSGNKADLESLRLILKKLSPTNLVRVFVECNKEYYYKQFRDADFPYFNAVKYIHSNNDVYIAVRGQQDPELYALEHYLNQGIYEARSSETSFDCVIAVLVSGDSCIDYLLDNTAGLDDFRTIYTQQTGNNSTDAYKLMYRTPIGANGLLNRNIHLNDLLIITAKEYEQLSDDNSSNSENTDDCQENNQETGKTGEGEITFPQIDEEILRKLLENAKDSNQHSDNTASSDSPSDNEEPDDPVESQNQHTYINSNSKNAADNFSAYSMYSLKKNASGNYTNERITVGDSAATFYGANYNRFASSNNDDYTFMIYMCASDQDKESYQRVSLQVITMLKSALDHSSNAYDNVNIVLCVGGGSIGFQAPYLKNNLNKENSTDNSQMGIYYLNLNALSEDAKTQLAKFDAGDDSYVSKYSSIRDNESITTLYNLCINSDTLVPIMESDSYVSMGKAETLTGFMNLATDLFPADNYGLSLSNHGGGLNSGVCFSGSNDDSLETGELELALSKTNLYMNNNAENGSNKLGMLFFDACEMGSYEEAYILSDFYKYMIASEETTTSWTDYSKILPTILDYSNEELNDKGLAEKIASTFQESAWHTGAYSDPATLAVYDATKVSETVLSMEQVGKELSLVLQSDNQANVVKAIRKSLLSCELYDGSPNAKLSYSVKNRDTVDIGEFLNYLKKNLKSISGYTDESSLMQAINSALELDFATYSSHKYFEGREMFTSGVESTLRKLLRGTNDNYYGASIFVGNASDTKVDKFYGNNNTYLNAYDNNTSGMNNYLSMLEKYYSGLSSSYNNDINELKSEMNSSDYKSLVRTAVTARLSGSLDNYPGVSNIVGAQGIYKYTDNLGSENFAAFTVKDSYSDINNVDGPSHSTGSYFWDELETADRIRAARVQSFSYTTSENVSKTVDMIVSDGDINQSGVSLDANSIFVSCDTSYSGLYAYGVMVKDTNGQYQNKQYIILDTLQDDDNNRSKIAQLAEKNSNDCYIFSGYLSHSNNTEYLENVCHLFVYSNNEYVYSGSYSWDGSSFSKLNNGNEYNKISFNRYYLDEYGQKQKIGYFSDDLLDLTEFGTDYNWYIKKDSSDINNAGYAISFDGEYYSEIAKPGDYASGNSQSNNTNNNSNSNSNDKNSSKSSSENVNSKSGDTSSENENTVETSEETEATDVNVAESIDNDSTPLIEETSDISEESVAVEANVTEEACDLQEIADTQETDGSQDANDSLDATSTQETDSSQEVGESQETGNSQEVGDSQEAADAQETDSL